MTSSGAPSPPVGQVLEEPSPGVGGLGRPRPKAEEDRLAVGVDAPGGQHRLGLGLGVHLEEAAVQVEVVEPHRGQVAPAPGVELGPKALADPADGGAADGRLLAEDLGQHRLHVTVRQPPHPAGDDQRFQRVGPGDALAEQLLAQRRMRVAQLRPLHLDGPSAVLIVMAPPVWSTIP